MDNRKKKSQAAGRLPATMAAPKSAVIADRGIKSANDLNSTTSAVIADLLNARIAADVARAFATNAHVMLRTAALQERFARRDKTGQAQPFMLIA